MRNRRLAAWLVLAWLLPSAPGLAKKKPRPGHAISAQDLRKKKADAERRKAEAERRAGQLAAERQHLEQEERAILPQIERYDKDSARIRAQLKGFNDQIAVTRAQIEACRRQQRLTGAELVRSQARFKGFLRVWYEEGAGAPLADAAAWGAEAEASRVTSARQTGAEEERQERQLGDSLRRLSALQRRADGVRRQLAASRKAKADYLDTVRSAKSQREAMLGEIRAKARELDRVLGELGQQERAHATRARAEAAPVVFAGELLWPADGEVIRRFGPQKHKDFNATIYSSGIEIAAQAGDPVRASESGRVAFSDWLQGYGRVMIVDHGNARFTLYGHLQDVDASVNDAVKRGQVIATVGDSGDAGEPSLYFEFRSRGIARDPLRYLGRRR